MFPTLTRLEFIISQSRPAAVSSVRPGSNRNKSPDGLTMSIINVIILLQTAECGRNIFYKLSTIFLRPVFVFFAVPGAVGTRSWENKTNIPSCHSWNAPSPAPHTVSSVTHLPRCHSFDFFFCLFFKVGGGRRRTAAPASKMFCLIGRISSKAALQLVFFGGEAGGREGGLQ